MLPIAERSQLGSVESTYLAEVLGKARGSLAAGGPAVSGHWRRSPGFGASGAVRPI